MASVLTRRQEHHPCLGWDNPLIQYRRGRPPLGGQGSQRRHLRGRSAERQPSASQSMTPRFSPRPHLEEEDDEQEREGQFLILPPLVNARPQERNLRG